MSFCIEMQNMNCDGTDTQATFYPADPGPDDVPCYSLTGGNPEKHTEFIKVKEAENEPVHVKLEYSNGDPCNAYTPFKMSVEIFCARD